MELETKDPEIKPHPLCLENISKEFSVNDMKKKKKQNKMERYTIFLLAMRLSMPVILKTFTSI